MRFQVSTATSMKITLLWDVAPCCLVESDRFFLGVLTVCMIRVFFIRPWITNNGSFVRLQMDLFFSTYNIRNLTKSYPDFSCNPKLEAVEMILMNSSDACMHPFEFKAVADITCILKLYSRAILQLFSWFILYFFSYNNLLFSFWIIQDLKYPPTHCYIKSHYMRSQFNTPQKNVCNLQCQFVSPNEAQKWRWEFLFRWTFYSGSRTVPPLYHCGAKE